jgi:hypothetical protein
LGFFKAENNPADKKAIGSANFHGSNSIVISANKNASNAFRTPLEHRPAWTGRVSKTFYGRPMPIRNVDIDKAVRRHPLS